VTVMMEEAPTIAGKPAIENCGTSLCGFSVKKAVPAMETTWATSDIGVRLAVLRRARHLFADRAGALAAKVSPNLARTQADTLVSEVLPLLEACKFLERNAARALRPRRPGAWGRPIWLSGVRAEIRREPLGHVLIIGPANFPLFLPGAQALQALAAGNSVTWKPGSGGEKIAQFFAQTLADAGLPAGTLTITDESIEAAKQALAASPDKVIFTGSSESGAAVLCNLAATTTPAVVELSGADAVIVTADADLPIVARAVAFGLRLNGGAVCMSPRRLFATPETMLALRPHLEAELARVPATSLTEKTAVQLKTLLAEAVADGAQLLGAFTPEAQRPLLVERATPAMAITRSDFFAPVLSLISVESMMHLPQMYAQCPYALTLSIFSGKRSMKKAQMVAGMLKAGTVLINDLIVPTADPRVPFGGRGASGYGVTRGAEGLLEMTAVKTVLVRRGGAMRHFDATSDADMPLFTSMISMLHGKGWTNRWRALRGFVTASKR
jgi:acyl-CoA reductase-like NAD-dependent aldehyde dehydrogenase